MVKLKSSHLLEGNKSKISTDSNKGQYSKPKKCIGKKPQNKPNFASDIMQNNKRKKGEQKLFYKQEKTRKRVPMKF